MGHFERHLRELGTKDRARSWTSPAPAPSRSWPTELASWDTWYDISPYGDDRVPFFKRAQIAAADLALSGLADPTGLDRLTLFADNLVPHVLRIDGVLTFDDDLVDRIEARGTDRARLARGGRDPRLRAARGRAARPSARQHDRDRRRQRALAPRRRAALQGAPPPPCPHHRLLTSSGSRASTRSSTRCGSAPRSSRSRATVNRRERLAEQLAPDLTLPEMRPGDEIVAFAQRPRFDLDARARAPRPGDLPRGAAPARQPRRGDPGRRGRRRRRRAHHRRSVAPGGHPRRRGAAVRAPGRAGRRRAARARR